MALAAALLLCACSTARPSHVWTEAALDAETLQFRGDLPAARDAYESLLPTAPTEDKRRWLLFRAATLELEAGNVELGRQKLEAIYEADVFDHHGANAMYEVAKLLDAQDPAAARAMRLRTIRRYPDQVAADFALEDIVNAELARDEVAASRALATTLEELHAEVPGAEVADNILFRLARVQDLELGQHDAALDNYRAIYRDYRRGPLADDALWELAGIYRRHQAWQPATRVLTILANDRESSWFIGSYDSAWVDDAIFDLGLIHLLRLEDYAGAVYWFERYLKEFGAGIYADNAGWHIVQAHRLSGDDAAYRQALRDFVRDFPESRFVRDAHAALGGVP